MKLLLLCEYVFSKQYILVVFITDLRIVKILSFKAELFYFLVCPTKSYAIFVHFEIACFVRLLVGRLFEFNIVPVFSSPVHRNQSGENCCELRVRRNQYF